jgi:LasA protease
VTLRSRVLGALGIIVGLLLIAPSVSATETHDTAGTAQPARHRFFPPAVPAFRLPFAPGQPVTSTGIHPTDGAAGPRNALDLRPYDGIVRAPLAGTVHAWKCAGGEWLTIDHRDGWRTGYYHLAHPQVGDGQWVEPGEVLGTVGTESPCGGGSWGGPDVRLTLWLLDASPAQRAVDPTLAGDWDGLTSRELATRVAPVLGEPIGGKSFGGWRFFGGDARHTGRTVHQSDGRTVPLPGTFAS